MTTEDSDSEIVICGTRSVYQAVAARTHQAEKEGRVILVDEVICIEDNHAPRLQADASLIGRRVYKKFGKRWYFGTVERVVNIAEEGDDEEEECYYRIEYDDGDSEDMSGEEVEPWLHLGEKYRHKDPKFLKEKKHKEKKHGAKQGPSSPPRNNNSGTKEATSAGATTPVQVKRERKAENASIVTPPPAKKKRLPPPPYQARTMCNSTIAWVQDLAKWLEEQNKMSAGNGKSIIRQVDKLARGIGIGYPNNWPADVKFLPGQSITLCYDFDHLMNKAKLYEDKYGVDKGHGWLLRHPLKKLKLFQAHCGVRPTKKAAFK